MAFRIAAIMGLMAFSVCLVVGAFAADNTFETAVTRALVALVGTLCVGLLVGTMAQKMLDENMKRSEEKIKKISANPTGDGR